jgi:hypothetical protein
MSLLGKTIHKERNKDNQDLYLISIEELKKGSPTALI